MWTDANKIKQCREKLYIHYREYTKFESLDAESLQRVKDRIKHYYKINPKGYDKNSVHRMTQYAQLVMFVCGSKLTFDEKIAFVIFVTDPDYMLYKLWLNEDMLTIDDIKKEKNQFVRDQLIEQYRFKESELESKVRKQIGYYDRKMIPYERDLYNKMENKLIEDTVLDFSDALLSKYVHTDFSDIDRENLDKCKKVYRELNNQININNVFFHLLDQSKAIGLNTHDEIFAFLVEMIDPELKLLEIYYNYSNFNEMKEIAMKEIGFFYDKLIQIEKDYHKKLKPEKILSIWQ